MIEWVKLNQFLQMSNSNPINIVQLLELKFVILGPTPLLIKFTPEYQNIINNPITINTDEINETIDNWQISN